MIKQNSKILILFLIIIINIDVFSQFDTITYHSNPDKYLAGQILENKIVMLSDFSHHWTVSQNTLISVLNEWLNLIIDIKSENYLTLILECSQEDVELLNNYIKSNNILDIVKSSAMVENIEDLEFYYLLAQFSRKVDSLNTFSKSKIFFNIKGFEQIGKNPPDTFRKMTRRELELYFVNNRDSITACDITSYLETNPSFKSLIFYGGAHLINKYVKKRTTVLKENESKGYYIAYYLKKNFGNEKVLTVNQIIKPTENYEGTLFDTVTCDIYVKSDKIPWQNFNPDYYDAFILRKSNNSIYPHPLKNVYCKFMIEKWIEYIDAENRNDSNYSTLILNTDYCDIFFGEKFESIYYLKKWYKSEKDFDSFKKLNSITFANKIFNYFYSDVNDDNRRIYLHKLGFILSDLNPLNIPDTVEWKGQMWPEALKHILFFNSLGIYWVGYPDEKLKAKEYLYQFSGNDFTEPIYYFKWYRKKYYNINY